MHSDSATAASLRTSPFPLPLQVQVDAEQVTSDGGLPWLAEAEAAIGICAALAARLPDWRRRASQHSLEALVRQRVFQIACGYQDQNDATSLRTDPLLELVCGRRPLDETALASQPTFSRLENAVDRRSCYWLAYALAEVYLRQRAPGDGRAGCCSTWIAPTTPPTATRRAPPIMAITSSTCTIPC